jgi:hypothetical protein
MYVVVILKNLQNVTEAKYSFSGSCFLIAYIEIPLRFISDYEMK